MKITETNMVVGKPGNWKRLRGSSSFVYQVPVVTNIETCVWWLRF